MKFALAALFVIACAQPAFAAETCATGKTEFIAAVITTPENQIEVWINTRENWLERGALVDSYSEQQHEKVDAITDVVQLCNLAESQYEPCGPRKRDQLTIVDALEQQCVENDPEFQAWAENEIQQ